MDPLSPDDTNTLYELLQEFFEPLGTNEQFVIVAIGRDRVATVAQLSRDNAPQLELKDLLRRLLKGEQTTTLTIDF